jgi:uncharacterized Zn-finger protein
VNGVFGCRKFGPCTIKILSTSSKEPNMLGSAQPISRKRAFSCDECQMLFKSDRLLKKRQGHINERPFSCNQCGRAFKRDGCHKKHEKI